MEKVLSGIGMFNPVISSNAIIMSLLRLVREYLFKYSVSWTVQVVTTSSFEYLQVKRNGCIHRLDRKLLLMDKTNFLGFEMSQVA